MCALELVNAARVVPSLGRMYRVGAVIRMTPWLEVDFEER